MWFRKRSDDLRLANLEERVKALEHKISSASDILEATERMDRVIKRSFRLKQQMDALENQGDDKANPPVNVQSRSQLLRMGVK